MANGVSVFSGKAKGYKDINLLNSVLKISLRCLSVFIIFISVIMYITKSYFINMMTDLAIVANYANDYSIYLICIQYVPVWTAFIWYVYRYWQYSFYQKYDVCRCDIFLYLPKNIDVLSR